MNKTVVTYWCYHKEPVHNALVELIKRFEAINPSIRIDFKTFPYNVYTTKVVAAVTTGQGPDIVYIHGSWAYAYINSGLILPVPEHVLSREEFEKEFFPLVDSFVSDNAYYAIPIVGSNLGLYYNKSMFLDAGIDHPPRTWSELKTMAKKIDQKGPSRSLTARRSKLRQHARNR